MNDILSSNSALSKQGSQDAYRRMGFDPNGNNEVWGSLRRLFPSIFEEAASNAAFGSHLNGAKQSGIERLIALLNPANQQAQMQGIQRGNTERAAQGARQASLMNRAQGLGDGFQAGTTNAMFGAANRQNNDVAREYASPEHAIQGLQALLRAISYGQQNPEMEELYRMGGVLEQRHQQNQGELGSGSFLRQASPYIGMAVGSGKLF
jgi:hypothetical protein